MRTAILIYGILLHNFQVLLIVKRHVYPVIIRMYILAYLINVQIGEFFHAFEVSHRLTKAVFELHFGLQFC